MGDKPLNRLDRLLKGTPLSEVVTKVHTDAQTFSYFLPREEKKLWTFYILNKLPAQSWNNTVKIEECVQEAAEAHQTTMKRLVENFKHWRNTLQSV
jgi:hypothetical protein